MSTISYIITRFKSNIAHFYACLISMSGFSNFTNSIHIVFYLFHFPFGYHFLRDIVLGNSGDTILILSDRLTKDVQERSSMEEW